MTSEVECTNEPYDVTRKIFVEFRFMSSRALVKLKLYEPNTCCIQVKKDLGIN
jgi:hypothetical protein